MYNPFTYNEFRAIFERACQGSNHKVSEEKMKSLYDKISQGKNVLHTVKGMNKIHAQFFLHVYHPLCVLHRNISKAFKYELSHSPVYNVYYRKHSGVESEDTSSLSTAITLAYTQDMLGNGYFRLVSYGEIVSNWYTSNFKTDAWMDY